MGLALSHDGPSRSYTGFYDWRKAIVKLMLNDELENYVGFGGKKRFPKGMGPLRYLIDHSDCDGSITAKRCAAIAPILRDIAKELSKGDSYEEEYTLAVAGAMERAAEEGSPLEFA